MIWDEKTYIIYSGCDFNTNTALKCLWQCTEVLYILTYVIVVRGRKKQNHGDTSIQLNALIGKLSLFLTFQLGLQSEKEWKFVYCFAYKITRTCWGSVELYFAFS